MATRIYVITNKDDQVAQALIEASSAAQALAYMTREMFECRPATAKEVAEAYKHGMSVQVVPEKQAKAPLAVVPGVNLPPGVLPKPPADQPAD